MMRGAAKTARSALLGAILLATSACISGWPDAESRVVRYICGIDSEGTFGRLDVIAYVSPDRRRVSYQRTWTAEPDPGRLSLRLDWRGPAGAPPPATKLRIALTVPPERRSWSRLIIRRDGPDGERIYRSPPFNPPGRWSETMSWRRFAALMGDSTALHLALVRRDGRIVTQAVLPRSILAAPWEASDALNKDLEQSIADPDRSCQPEMNRPIFIA